MRIVIDMDGYQTESCSGAIGHSIFSFVQALVRNKGEHEVLLALSDLHLETIEPIRAVFHGILPQENIRVWHAPNQVNEGETDEKKNRGQARELIREAFLASHRPDAIYFSNSENNYTCKNILNNYSLGCRSLVGITISGINDKREIDKLPYSQTAKLTKYFSEGESKEKIIELGSENLDNFALKIIEDCSKISLEKTSPHAEYLKKKKKLRLAFVSPLPPERTGIADYSAELIPCLSKYYEIELVVIQEHVDESLLKYHGKTRDVNWLRENAKNLDRVLYHIGNSPFHAHMLPLMSKVPGTVVLHDFFIGDLISWIDSFGSDYGQKTAYYDSHGYIGLGSLFNKPELARSIYPVNTPVLQHAKGVIVHSKHSRALAAKWYGSNVAKDFKVIPLLRATHELRDRSEARKQLGYSEQDFIVCSFGFMGPAKLNHRLITAWLATTFAKNKNAVLIFAGDNNSESYAAELMEIINSSGCKNRIKITGFLSSESLKNYLAATDVAVQLRAQSRGETSAAVLDCMNYGLPVIVNANGAMAELDRRAVYMMPDNFDNELLTDALEILYNSPLMRTKLAESARVSIIRDHSPDACAQKYVKVIEDYYTEKIDVLPSLVGALTRLPDYDLSVENLKQLAAKLACNHPKQRLLKRLYLDVTVISGNDLKTGIQRVVRALTLAMLESPPQGYRVEPVRLVQEGGVWYYRHASHFTLGVIGLPTDFLEDEIASPELGDVFLALDLTGDMLIQAERAGLYKEYRNQGTLVYAMVYDLLPVRMPEVFPQGADQSHKAWLEAISNFDGAIGISNSVAEDFRNWQIEAGVTFKNRRSYAIDWFHLGADIDSSAPSYGLPQDAKETIKKLKAHPTFIMVGTIEPRKAYAQTLSAFELLWREGIEINLVIVGREGWKGWVPPELCRDIPETVKRLKTHTELKKRLFWLEGISDEYLEQIYVASNCLIAASYGEGFGLPLIEAAQNKLSIIARDIQVFREVAGVHAYYFKADQPMELAQAIKSWLVLFKANKHIKSENMPWLTWKESTIKMLKVLNLNNSD